MHLCCLLPYVIYCPTVMARFRFRPICAESAVKPQENKRTLLLPGVNFETGQVGWTSRKECCILWRRSHPKHTGSDAWHVWLW